MCVCGSETRASFAKVIVFLRLPRWERTPFLSFSFFMRLHVAHTHTCVARNSHFFPGGGGTKTAQPKGNLGLSGKDHRYDDR